MPALLFLSGSGSTNGTIAVFCAADSQASLEAWIEGGIRLRVDDVDRVVLIDGNAAGPAELFPLVEEFSVLVEDLDSVIRAIGHEKTSSGIHRDRMRCIHFARSFAFFAPGFDEFSDLREFNNAAIDIYHVSIAYTNLTLG